MSLSDRQEQILTLLTRCGMVSVHRLAQELFVSEATIRRDLAALERQGRVRRTFGGAVATELLNREVPLTLRTQEHAAAKERIAQTAAAYLQDGQTVFLDASSTALHLVPYLTRFRDLTAVTNGPRTALALGGCGVPCICTGGTLLPNSAAFAGPEVCEFLRRFNLDAVFFSCRGVTTDGLLCDSSLEESHVRETLLQGTGKKIFLCDTSKLGKTYRYNLCSLRNVDAVVCELEQLPENYAAFLS